MILIKLYTLIEYIEQHAEFSHVCIFYSYANGDSRVYNISLVKIRPTQCQNAILFPHKNILF